MTQRERQLLEWIRENPMISQQELADKAGITRSSVAVHISNLIKKGCITGKGYICLLYTSGPDPAGRRHQPGERPNVPPGDVDLCPRHRLHLSLIHILER